MKEKKLTPTYSPDYYKFQKTILSSEFKADTKWLYSRYEKFKLPVPKGGFETPKAYENWCKKIVDLYTKIYESKDRNIVAPLDFKVKNELLPPLPGKFVNATLEQFGFDSKNKKYHEFLSRYLFRGATAEYREEPFKLEWARDPKTNKFRLIIELHPYTKREHIIEEWDFIANQQKKLKNYLGKNKPWETFSRDLFIFNTHRKLKAERKGQKQKEGIDIGVWREVKKKYPGIELEQIMPAVSRVKKLDKKRV